MGKGSCIVSIETAKQAIKKGYYLSYLDKESKDSKNWFFLALNYDGGCYVFDQELHNQYTINPSNRQIIPEGSVMLDSECYFGIDKSALKKLIKKHKGKPANIIDKPKWF